MSMSLAVHPSALARIGWTRVPVMVAGLVFVCLVGWVDYLTGNFSMAVFYLLPICGATWLVGRSSGIVMSIASSLASFWSELLAPTPEVLPALPYWNSLILAVLFVTVVQLLSALIRLQTDLENWVRQRTESLSRANAELQAAQRRLIDAEKLESIGRLAAGVAHEVKNPLMIISMVNDFMKGIVPADDPDAAALLEDSRDAVERANRIISELLDFARPGVLEVKVQPFRPVAEAVLEHLKLPIARKRIRVVTQWCDPEPPSVALDRFKMEQALVNLVGNAIQAMPNEGTLTLRTLTRAGRLIVEIDDTGQGISPVIEAKLFDPFFTTKAPGEGTGLGLPVTRQIVLLHGGSLTLANRPEGRGARATIELPISPPKTHD